MTQTEFPLTAVRTAVAALLAAAAVSTASPSLAADGTDGPSLTVSTTEDLSADGATVTVTGSGFDTSRGIYVALCDVSGSESGSTTPPTPCIGGVDMEGASGSSAWISSNPPPYGEGLATPYDGTGADGGFTIQLTLRAKDEFTDCLADGVQCAVISRNDHTRTSDRGQDVFVPVTFTDDAGRSTGPAEPADTAPPAPAEETGSSVPTAALVGGFAVLVGATVAVLAALLRRRSRR
ncbi:hypothetical protein [Nocardiopsis ansamitocini]|uniref:Neocarzinostatin family protein n=1 Tax=Nocardiopsis ansamitocini TaxID=1670832 RepID=A0A9W6UKW9_9ACTN|nr:hypothetical protein [Nocardiopsis ansamitocini]GLU50434.1 hypothetical protein Nans01_47850 [Nocardiopsis ansamitocini]